MNGMDRHTGKALAGIEHLRQSITDLLTTPLGSRLMRPDYGSRLFDALDAPTNAAMQMELYTAVAEALTRWEPRFVLSRVQLEGIYPGQVQLTIEGQAVENGQPLRFEGLRL